ncbi:MAG: septal ring lytic transglycosylase RlpA family protein [Mailhella sp.]|nr:septal ring lytic transglycosylase RlpA family protein [Mailhella sp.]
MKHCLYWCLCTLAAAVLLAAPDDAVAKQEKRQNYVYLEGESKTTYHTSDVLTGLAAWYGDRLHGNKTSSGERFDCNKLTAAHRSLPFGTVLKVTNLRNKKQVMVRVTDRGPLSTRFIIDLSKGAARELNMIRAGIAPVSLEIIQLPEWYSQKYPHPQHRERAAQPHATHHSKHRVTHRVTHRK